MGDADPEQEEELFNTKDANNPLVPGSIKQYGWLILIVVAIVAYLWSKYGKSLRARRQESSESLDPEEFYRRQEAMEAARRLMQEKVAAQAAYFKEKQEEKEALKSQQRVEDWERHQKGLGYRSKYKSPETNNAPDPTPKKPTSGTKKRLRPDGYNPLMGDTSSGYRPSRDCSSQGGG